MSLWEEMGFQKESESGYGGGVLNVLRERVPEEGGCMTEGSWSHGGEVSRGEEEDLIEGFSTFKIYLKSYYKSYYIYINQVLVH